MTPTVVVAPCLCEECSLEGKVTLADYVAQPEEISLQGPEMGDPDYWPDQRPGWQSLCRAHFQQLPSDCRLDYAPVAQEETPIF